MTAFSHCVVDLVRVCHTSQRVSGGSASCQSCGPSSCPNERRVYMAAQQEECSKQYGKACVPGSDLVFLHMKPVCLPRHGPSALSDPHPDYSLTRQGVAETGRQSGRQAAQATPISHGWCTRLTPSIVALMISVLGSRSRYGCQTRQDAPE